jgi:hypothetical protein
MKDGKTAVVLTMVVVVLGAAGILAFYKPRTGQSSNSPPTVIGTYRTLDACRADIGKVGSWCGKGAVTLVTGRLRIAYQT